MRRHALLWVPLAASAAVLAVPADTEAGPFRRARGCPCPAPAAYAPGYGAPWYSGPGYPALGYPAPAYPAAPAPFAAAPGATQVTPPAPTVVRTIVSRRTNRPYQLIDTGESVAEETDVTPITPTGKIEDPNNSFRGKARRKAKVSVAHAPPEAFASVSELIETLVPDSDMSNDTNITKKPDSDRVEAENRNVTVAAFLYAFKKEADNDYHVIVGDPPGTPGGKFFNVEISGLPTAEDNPTAATKKRLTAARKTFKEFFELGNTGPGSYTRPHQPIPVLVSGSLFWDIEHPPPNTVGPTATKPRTAWEIHPITSIVLDYE